MRLEDECDPTATGASAESEIPLPSEVAGAERDEEQRTIRRAVETAIRIAVVALIAYLCFRVFEPFLMATLWGAMTAVALFPTYKRLTILLGKRSTLAAVLIAVGLFSLFVVPAVVFIDSLAIGVEGLVARFRAGTLTVPPPPAGLESFPLVGARLQELWLLASQDLRQAVQKTTADLDLGTWLLGLVRSSGAALVQFALATGIAGLMLATAERGTTFLRRLAVKLSPEQGAAHLVLAEQTVRSVAVGVLGVAALQTVLAGTGFLVAGVPGAGLLTLVSLVLAIVQIGVGLPMIGAAIYLFAHASTTTAVLFAIWVILVAPLDNILRPMLLGRGVGVPMLVIFIGAIGGLLQVGLIGMFLGSVMFALGYQLVRSWLGLTPAQVGAPADQAAP